MKKDPLSELPRFTPFILFIVSFLTNLFFINKGPYHPDSLFLITQAQKTLETGQLQPYLSGYNLPVLLGAFSIWLSKSFGLDNPTAAVNLVNVLTGALTVPVFYSLCRKITDVKAAFLGSLILFSLPLFLSLSTFGNSHAPAILFLIAGLKFLNDYANIKSPASLIAAAVCFGFCGACRPQDLALMSLPISYFYFSNATAKRISFPGYSPRILYGRFLLFGGLILLTILLVPLPFIGPEIHKHGLLAFKKLYRTYPSTINPDVKYMLSMFQYSFETVIKELTPLTAFVGLYGAILTRKENPRLFAFLSFWFFCPWIFYASLLYKFMPTGRYFLITLFPLVIFAGIGFSTLLRKPNKLIQRSSFFFFMLIPVLGLSQILPTLAARHQNNYAMDFCRWVTDATEPNAVVISSIENNFLTQHGKRRNADWPSEKKIAAFDDWFEKEIREGHPVYVLVPAIILKGMTPFKNHLNRSYNVFRLGEKTFEFWQDTETNLLVTSDRLYKINGPRHIKGPETPPRR